MRRSTKSLVRAMIMGVVSAGFMAYPNHGMVEAQTVYNTPMPSVIRVAIRPNNDPLAPIAYVQTLGFQEYCEDVLPNEWMPSWNAQTLRAGAIAIKMFAWYHTLHPVSTGGWTYDVDNTTNYQQFKYLSGTTITNQAVLSTWNIVYVPATGDVTQLNYRAGIPNNPNWAFVGSNMMAQWGSEYWGRTARLTFPNVLGMYYPGLSIQYI